MRATVRRSRLVSCWLLDRGADADAAADVDADGFGAQTPLFHTVVTLSRKNDRLARLLLEAGADPNARATLRKQFRDLGDPEKETLREFRNVTPIAYARRFAEPAFVNDAAIAAVVEHGGTE